MTFQYISIWVQNMDELTDITGVAIETFTAPKFRTPGVSFLEKQAMMSLGSNSIRC